MIGVFARKHDWGFGIRWSFERFNAGVIDRFGFFDRFQAILQASTNSIDVGLDPDQGGRIAGRAQDFGQFATLALGADATFDDESGAGFGDLLDQD